MMRLSQGQLNLLATCPRKFQHTYLEQLAAPIDPEQQERLTWGTRFHLLAQQWQLGLPVEPLAKENVQLQRWFSAFIQAAPTILNPTLIRDETESREPALANGESTNGESANGESANGESANGESASNKSFCQSEHVRMLEFQGYLLTVVYDLLMTTPQQASILDWKTYPRPQKPDWLLQNWQTRLYPFVLVETSDYAPESVSMTYWFFQFDGDRAIEPQSYTLTYSRTQHEQTRLDLATLLTQLTTWLERYQAGEAFPQLPLADRECDRCSFAIRCDRATPQSGNELRFQPGSNLTDIQEIPLA